jgi:hypothetical protein
MTYKVFLSKTAYKTYSKVPAKLRKGIGRCLIISRMIPGIIQR